MKDSEIIITFEGSHDTQSNELEITKILRHAILDAVVDAAVNANKPEINGIIEVELAGPDPNKAGSKGELLLRFAAHIAAGTLAGEHDVSNTILLTAIAEAIVTVVEYALNITVKLKCPKGDELKIEPSDSKKEKLGKTVDWLKKCLLQLAKKNGNDDDS